MPSQTHAELHDAWPQTMESAGPYRCQVNHSFVSRKDLAADVTLTRPLARLHVTGIVTWPD